MNHRFVARSSGPSFRSLGFAFSLVAMLGTARALSTVDPADTRMLEQPAISARNIAFAYAGDLWICDRNGDHARRLTSHSGLEENPRFSPDGNTLAFEGEYDGNRDIYVMPVTGGEPRRLTWHPGSDGLQGFAPDGNAVLLTSNREGRAGSFAHLYRQNLAGGLPEAFPLPTCTAAAMSPDGKRIAYNPLRAAFEQWKNYRGGTASRLWIYDVATRAVNPVPQPATRSNDVLPMWVGDVLYFVSDRDGEFNLYRYDGKDVKALTAHTDFPIQNANVGDGVIVYEQAGWIHVYDPKVGESKRVVIGVAADLVETRPRFVKGAQYVRAAEPSPSGARAVIAFRGEILSVPTEKGDVRNLTHTTNANERFPVWSPDGATIAYFSDVTGENQLMLAPQDGKSPAKAYALQGAGFYDTPQWSPDSKSLCYFDNGRVLWLFDVASGTSKKVAEETIYGVFPTLFASWSPDSRYLAYTAAGRTGFRRAYLYDLKSGASTALTDGLADVSEPVFDAAGKYLFLAASTEAGPFISWFSQASSDVYMRNSLYVIPLAASTPTPFAAESDEEKPKSAASEPKKEETAAAPPPVEGAAPAVADATTPPAPPASPAVPETKIDLDGIASRILALPVEPAFYYNLRTGPEGRLYYLKAKRQNFMGGPEPAAFARFDLAERKEKEILPGVARFSITSDRQKVMLAGADGMWITPLGDMIDKSKGRLPIESIEVKIDPRAEWQQIFEEVWRINRDCFYDPGMHGADWAAMKARYAPLVTHCATRGDLNRIIRWLCSELGVGHSYSGGGDTLIKADRVGVGLLGADYEIADGHYRFKKVYGELNWAPELKAPLREPGVDVRSGDFLLAVDGVPLLPSEDVHARFENRVGKQVRIEVAKSADGKDARTVTVVPIAGEHDLRHRDWVEGNLKRVTEATNGRVAYVYVPNTADEGFVYFKRYFFPQADREAIILDERMNGGGSVADYYIDILRRPYIANWATRYGESLVTPQAAIFGPKVMLIDENAGSGGDLLPWMFRKFGLGKLIGRPTWGGLVGILGFPELMDGGMVTAPNIGIWTEEEGFCVENVGVPPDIEVELTPIDCANGRDPQLERAIAEVMKELEANPPKRKVQPPFPVRVRK